MHALIKYNNDNKITNLIELAQSNLQTPIILFEINLNHDKKKCEDELFRIICEKDKFNQYDSMILIYITDIFDFTASFVNKIKNHFNFVAGYGGLNKINRFFIENTKIDCIIDPHNSTFQKKHDFIHHFNSGINHILAKIANEKHICFINSLNFIDEKKKDFKDFSRINQNIKLFYKYNLDFTIEYLIDNQSYIKSEKDLFYIKQLFNIKNDKINTDVILDRMYENIKTRNNEKIKAGIKIL